jgi:hypothetical protein
MNEDERNRLRARLVSDLLAGFGHEQRENWAWMLPRPDYFPEDEWRKLYVEETGHDEPGIPVRNSMRGTQLCWALSKWMLTLAEG